ncbi:MAG TPA: VWA domain-containing protein [Candidatus Binatia bacterium]|nr:VWA domain-containing protein [Candidatus Binatia bacterium]
MNFEQRRGSIKTRLVILAVASLLAVPLTQAQSGTSQNQSPSGSSAQNIPDAPSTVQPPARSFPKQSSSAPAEPSSDQNPNLEPGASSSRAPEQPGDQEEHPAPPPMPPVQTIPPGTNVPPAAQGTMEPRNQINPSEGLYTFRVVTNFVQIPVMVRANGRRVDGLLPKDFTVLENGKPQKLTYFTSDPFLLSVAVVLDTGMPDVTLQKVSQTYEALVESFSPYDEFALYTYSTAVSQVTGFTTHPQLLTSSLNTLKLVRGRENGPAVLNGPLATGPTINGAPVGGPTIAPVNTPPKDLYVLNDAIMEAARGLSQQDSTRRKIILVISDGREFGSQASYKQVIRVLQTHGIQLKAVVLDEGALPGYRQAEKMHHLFRQGYDDILPKYSSATGGGAVYKELTRNNIENAYASITSDSRNQYTLGYNAKPIAGGSPYRSLEVLVDKKGLKIYAKDGFYFVPSIHPPPVQPK